MIDIQIHVYADEVILKLDNIPRQIRENLKAKWGEAFESLKSQLFTKSGGKYIDPEQLESGVTEIGGTTVGFLEYHEKNDKYPITPKSAAFLQFRAKDGAWVRTHLVLHPYPKGAPVVARLLMDSKPWLIEQVREAIGEALR